MRIAICDDNTTDLRKLQADLSFFLKVRGRTASVSAFSHPDALLEAARKKPFDIYLLDVVLDMITGIQVAKELRSAHLTAPIVFFSSSQEYAYEAFQVDAVTYVGKPWTQARFGEALERALAKVDKTEQSWLTLGKEGVLRRFPAEMIESVTTSGIVNYVTIRLSDGTQLETRSSLSSFAEDHQGVLRLFPIGRSLLINLRQVSALERGLVRFFSGSSLAVPRSAYGAIETALLLLSRP